MRFILTLLTLCVVSAHAHSASFDLSGVANNSTLYTNTQDGVTMTVTGDNLDNAPDSIDGLDFGYFRLNGQPGTGMTSFSVSFDADTLVTGFELGTNIFGLSDFDITGPGVTSLGNSIDGSASGLQRPFSNGPVLFQENQQYQFVANIDLSGTQAIAELVPLAAITTAPSPVPLPAAAYLFGSALFGLGLARRRKR